MYLNEHEVLSTLELDEACFEHRMVFGSSLEDAIDTLPKHVCLYRNTKEYFTFRPYLYQELSWDGWTVDENGNAVK